MVQTAFRELPPLPDATMKLLGAVNDERAGIGVLVSILRMDAALTAEVLRRANSPMYGLMAKVSSLGQAVMLLGVAEIRRMAMMVSLDKHFGSGQRSIRRLWRHAFARALVSERIAAATGLSADSAYSAGLLADIGIYGLMVSFPDVERRLIEESNGGHALLEAEEREYGVSHCQAGGWLARNWGLPEAIIAAVLGHHEIPGAGSLAAHVFWADMAVTCLAFGFTGNQLTTADLDGYARLRDEFAPVAKALPADAEELFLWLVERVPAS